MNHGPRSIYIFALRFKKLLEYVRDLFAHTPVVLVCHLLQCGIHRRRDGNGSPLIQIHLFTPRCVSVTVTHNNLHNGEVNNIMRPHNKNRDGQRSELLAAEWLLSQDCYVYQPVMAQGPVDLVAISPNGKTHLFDVKTHAFRSSGTSIARNLTDVQRKLGVRLLYVNLETGAVGLYTHQLSNNPVSTNKAQNRHFKGKKALTISELLHPEPSPTDQSCPEEHEQSADQSNPE